MADRATAAKRFCGHCETYVSKSVYYRHRRLYFNKLTNQWSSSRVFYSQAGTSVDLPSDGDTSTVQSSFFSDDDSVGDQPSNESEQFNQTLEVPSDSSSDDEEQDAGPEIMSSDVEDFDIESYDGQGTCSETPLLQLYTFFLFMFQSLFRLSDTALNTLIIFFSMFIRSISNSFPGIPEAFLNSFPCNLRLARKIIGSRNRAVSTFQKYVCCPACRSIYDWNECIIKKTNGTLESKRCGFIDFPNHPQIQHRKTCGEVLMKTMKCSSGRTILYPRMIYTYKSIIESLQEMLVRPGFLEKCEAWRSLPVISGVYNDIYDGKIWKEFQNPAGVPFLSVANNFAFQINVDWFNPFTHTQHSEGAIYLSILNLPRHERFLQENIMLVGVIPGPKEPSLHINSFLRPLVNELNSMWCGIQLKNAHGHSILVRGALICVGCDIPAARKVGGFVGHRATRGCSKCTTSFPTETFGEKADYSNFDRCSWEPHTNVLHRENAMKHLQSTTLAERKKIEVEHGVRYTALLDLPYFDAPRMCIIDPMHNLLLGTAKHVIDVWKRLSILDSRCFANIQQKVDSFIAPPDIGRMPSKITSGFSGFTADQWKNWSIFFSLFSLQTFLERPHYNCWNLFVKACYLLCRRSITTTQLLEGDKYLMDFCKKFVELYGRENCTINMHLHGHLVECIEDFGPVYSFWCFAYERMNGVLGSYHVNNHHISIQLTRRFLDSKAYAPSKWPRLYVDEYLPFLNSFTYHKGGLQQTTVESEISTFKSDKIVALPPQREYALEQCEQESIYPLFDTLLPSNTYRILVLSRRTRALLIQHFILGAAGSRHTKSSLVLAKNPTTNSVCLAEIQFFLQCTATSNTLNNQTTRWIAVVKWFMDHPCRVWFGNPTEVWSTASYPGLSFIFVHNIVSRVVYTKVNFSFGRHIGNDKVYVIVPLTSH